MWESGGRRSSDKDAAERGGEIGRGMLLIIIIINF
jgi:hypothetical protein